MRFLAIDVGNTSIHGAWREGQKWKKHFRLSSGLSKAELSHAVDKIIFRREDAEVFIASVVPGIGRNLKKILSKKISGRCVLVGRDCPVPIKNLYRRPRQVGVDRLLNAVAAYRRYHRAAIVIDFGTAITFDVINKRGEYLGGVIAPGIEISLDALFQRTALLPRIQLRHPRGVIGKDTVDSIRVGCSVGIGGLCDRVVFELAKAMKTRPLIIATGGYARFISRYAHSFKNIQEDLILDGIYYTAKTLPKSKIK